MPQARLLAKTWADGPVMVMDWDRLPTVAACVNRGWLVPTGEKGELPGILGFAQRYQDHALSPAGLVALRDFLTREIEKGA